MGDTVTNEDQARETARKLAAALFGPPPTNPHKAAVEKGFRNVAWCIACLLLPVSLILWVVGVVVGVVVNAVVRGFND